MSPQATARTGRVPGMNRPMPRPTDRSTATRAVIQAGLALGFGLVGVSRAKPSRYADHIRHWLASGQHGEMGYLQKLAPLRLDPATFVPGAVSIISVAHAYPPNAPTPPPTSDPSPTAVPPRGQIARYARGDDYHKVLKKKLQALTEQLRSHWPAEVFRCTTDTAPILEREHAAAAGLGFTGKNTMLIHPRHGSYTLLGCIVTSVDLADAAQLHYPDALVEPRDRCGGCTRCIDACPTQAIAPQGYTLDARRCVSYLTLEHRSTIDPALHAGIGDWIAGCDICQEVCPFNEAAKRRPLPIALRYRPRLHTLDLHDVLEWSADDRAKTFQGSALKRMTLDMVRRNALIALSNVKDQAQQFGVRRRVQHLAQHDPSDLVRETAGQILTRWASLDGDISQDHTA